MRREVEVAGTSSGADVGTELRVATIMTGGVSLAVWMGGVAAELLHLAEPDGPYAPLLTARGYDRVRLDVITGTSAGGIDGALLAAAATWGVGAARFTDDVRRVWLEEGAFETLLRSPRERAPTSLLRGDDHLLRRLEAQLEAWFPAEEERPTRSAAYLDPAEPPTRLIMTATLLEPRVEVFLATDGPLEEADHRGTFTFSGFDLLTATAPARLARAARTSSSYPGAFEPSWIATDSDRADDLGGIATGGGFAIDGGLLVNRPFGLALQAIFGQRATRPVERALLYVVPSLSRPEEDRPVEGAPAPSGHGEPPEVGPSFAALLGRTASLAASQTISDDLRSLADHDRRWRRQRANRIGWVAALLPDAREHLAESLWPEFTRRRAEGSVAATLRGVVRRNPHLDLRTDWARLVAGIEAGRHRADWHGSSFAATLPSADQPRWRWGVSCVEYLFQVALDLLRSSQPAPDDDGSAGSELARLRTDLHGVLDLVAAYQRLDAIYWDVAFRHAAPADREDWTGWAEQRYRDWPAVRGEVDARTRQHVVACLARIRGEVALLDAGTTEAVTGQDVLRAPADVLTQDEAQQRLTDVALAVAEVVRDWVELSAAGAVVPCDDAEADLQAALTLPPSTATSWSLLATLLTFWVIQSTTQHDHLEREQPVDLVPITGDGALKVDPQRRALVSEKLTGTQLANFGGFYKRAWRANDHLWGRLDAAQRIVRWLADPAEVAEVTRARQSAILEEELPHVAAAIRTSASEGAALTPSAAAFLEAVEAEHPPPAEELLGLLRVGEERLADERDSNAFLRTATGAAAVGAAILAGERGGLPWLRRLATRVRRWVILPVHTVVHATRRGARRGFGARAVSAVVGLWRGVIRVLRRS